MNEGFLSIPIDIVISGTHWEIAQTAAQGTVASDYTNMASLSAKDLADAQEVVFYPLILLIFKF